MKKIQRSFAVEYKTGRRKPDPKSHSIWGNIDLKSVAHDVQSEAMPFTDKEPQMGNSGRDVSLPSAEPASQLLTLAIGQQTTALAPQETTMTDENDTTMNADVPAATAPNPVEKVRKPRAKKASSEAASADVLTEPTDAVNTDTGKPKRGRKPKLNGGAASAKRAPVKRAPKVAQTETATASVEAVDEMADLLQLEQENQRLRKLLAEKLRAENADLKKRLNLG